MSSDSDKSRRRGARKGRKPTTESRRSKYFLSVGSEVEVCSSDVEFENAWFPATVLEAPEPTEDPPPGKRTKRLKTVRVRYHHMLTADGADFLIESLPVSLTRPRPPERPQDELLELNDVVDVFHEDVWWAGFVVRIDGDVYTVAFRSPPDVLEVGRSVIRAHLDWVDCKWVKPPKEVPTGSPFSVGSQVEFDLDEEKLGTTWLPAFSLGQVEVEKLLLKCKRLGKDGIESYNRREHVNRIRPCPPPIEKKAFELLEKVEVFRGMCWSVGLITRCLEGERYSVTFSHEKKEIDFDHKDLRLHLDWNGAKWITNSKGVQITEHVTPVCDKVKSVQIIDLDELEDRWDSSPPTEKSPCFESLNKDTANNSSKHDCSAAVVLIADHEVHKMQASVLQPWNSPKVTSSVVQKLGDQRDTSPIEESLYSEFIERVRGDKSVAITPLSNHENVRENKSLATRSAKTKARRNRKPTIPWWRINKQSSYTGINAEGRSSEVEKENLETDDTAREEFEISGMVMEPEERLESNGIRSSKEGNGDNPESPSSTFQIKRAIGDEISEAMTEVDDPSTEKSQSPLAATHSKSTDEQAQISPKSTDCSVADQAIVVRIEETFSLTNIGDAEPNPPFVKISPVWQFLESTELFRNSPQKPHFRPLSYCPEKDREGLAIGHMVNFTNLIGKIYKMQEHDPVYYMDNILEALGEYEELGFDVKVFQDQLNEIRKVKVEMEKLRGGLVGVRSVIKDCTAEMTKADEKVAEINEEMETLKRKLEMAKFESAQKQSKIVKLTSEAAVMEASYSFASESFRSLVKQPW